MTEPPVQSTHITALFPELLGVGGVQEAGRITVLALDAIVRRRGWSSSIAGLNDPAGAQILSIAGRHLAFQGFARAKGRFISAAIGRVRAAARCHAHIVLAGHPNLSPVAVWMQKTSARARAIVMAHGIEVWQPLPLVRRATIRAAHLVTAPSTDTIQKLIEIQRIAAARTRQLPWPLSPDFLRLTEAANLPLPTGFPEGVVILTIGRAVASERYKGTDHLIRAVAQFRGEPIIANLHLVAVGAGDDVARLRKLASDLGIAGRVHFFKDLAREELAACYARAGIFAMPSAGEGFGIVFLEAMAFGKPVVAAACGGALDIVQDGVNGLLVPPNESLMLASALRCLLGDASLRSALGSRGAILVREKYRFDAFEANLESIFEQSAMDSEKSS